MRKREGQREGTRETKQQTLSKRGKEKEKIRGHKKTPRRRHRDKSRTDGKRRSTDHCRFYFM